MGLTLIEMQAVSELADLLYSFLPGKAHPYASKSISFAGIANDLGLGIFWPNGSKLPAIIALIESTLSQSRGKFCPLLIEVVKRGIKYRSNKSNPVTKEDIELLNSIVVRLGFKVPELWDAAFLNSLPHTAATTKDIDSKEKGDVSRDTLTALSKEFLDLNKLEPHKRGFAFERFLQALFDAFNMTPRAPFRLVGEQIDGSIDFEGHTYLIEAKWQGPQIGDSELLVFNGKVAGKSAWSRGLFISYSGFSQEGLEAFSKGRPTNIIGVAGIDLYEVMQGTIALGKLIHLKARRASEEGRAYVSVRELVIR